MKLTHGAQTVETFSDKKVIKSGAVGSTTVEEVKWLTKTLVSHAIAWKSTGWGYVVDISQMSPVTPEISAELVNLHKELSAANCKAMAFVDKFSFMTAAQAKQHSKESHVQIQEGHFGSDEDAFNWIKTIVR